MPSTIRPSCSPSTSTTTTRPSWPRCTPVFFEHRAGQGPVGASMNGVVPVAGELGEHEGPVRLRIDRSGLHPIAKAAGPQPPRTGGEETAGGLLVTGQRGLHEPWPALGRVDQRVDDPVTDPGAEPEEIRTELDG